MKSDWPKTIKHRNYRELAGCAVVVLVLLSTTGLTFRVLPVLLGVGFVAWFIVRHAGWQVNPNDLLGVRRELIRQGRMMQFAWAWYVVPCVLPWLIAKPIPLSPSLAAVFIAGSIFIAWLNYRAGSALLAEAYR